MKLTEIYKEIQKIIKAGKGDYKFVNKRGMVAADVHKILVDDEKKEVTII